MSPQLKYFDLCGFKIFGRGGVVRVFLEANGVAFDDKEVAWGEFPNLKAEVIANENPSGSLPVLQDGDLTLSESFAIIRYLARTNNLQQDPKTEAISDMIADKVVPLRDATISSLLSGNEELQAKHKEERKNNYRIIETLLAKHASASGLISQNDKPTLGDAAVFAIAYDDARLFGKPEGDYPALKKLTDKVIHTPAIAAWLEKRSYGDSPLA